MKTKTGMGIVLCLWLALAGFTAGEAKAPSSIVPEQDMISDHESRMMLLDLLLQSREPEHLSRAGEVLDHIQRKRPDSKKAAVYRIRLEAAKQNRSQALSLAEDFVRTRKFDPETFLEVADVLASLKRYQQSRDIYLLALDMLEGDEKLETELLFAERSLLWGDFYSGERILREHLSRDPGDPELNLKLARNLVAQQRFEKARKYLKRVTRQEPENNWETYLKAWAEKIGTGLKEKNFSRAARDTDTFLDQHGRERLVLIPGGRAYLGDNRLEDALGLFKNALQHPELKPEARVGLAQTQIKRNNPEKAVKHLKQAQALDPEDPSARIMLAKHTGKPLADYVQKVVQSDPDPERLTNMAEKLAGQGELDLAAESYRSALSQAPKYFDARLGLAEVHASMGRYSKSLEILEDMLDSFPDSYKLLLTRARVLSWSGEYQESIRAYQDIYQENPGNHVPAKEAARTAYWGNMPDLGDKYYQKILTPAVDELFLEKLLDLEEIHKEQLGPGLGKLEQKAGNGSIFHGYQDFLDWYREHCRQLEALTREKIQSLKHGLNHRYKIQKKAHLERESKRLAWDRRFAPAKRHLKELVELDPGNQEALLDLAQMNCALGLGDEEKEAYQELLEMDPLHGQASKALNRRQERSSPSLFGGYSFWREKGRKEEGLEDIRVSRMHRHRMHTGVEVFFQSRHSLKLTGNKYFLSPRDHARSVRASGASLQGELVTGPYVTLTGGATYKTYSQDLETKGTLMEESSIDLDDLFLGYLNMGINLDNYASLYLGYEKREEVPNAVALAQGIYTHRYRAGLDIYPQRGLNLGLEGEYLDYSDGNHGRALETSAAYAFTQHPRRFRAIASVEHRDTSSSNKSENDQDQYNILQDFTHPYWTPENHWGSELTLEFTHDLAEEFFCGAREHYYQLELTLGTDKDRNHSAQVAGSWNREFSSGLGVNTRAMWHNSREWDAASMEMGFFYRF